MSTRLPWFRMYTDFLNDPKLIALAFEDQRHFIGVLALKSDGALDDIAEEALLNRIVAQRLWIDHGVISDVKRRLMNAGLIDSQWQPMAWAKRQMRSDADSTAAERQRRQRERNKSQAEDSHALRHAPSHATVTRLDTDTDTDREQEKTVKTAPIGFTPPNWINLQHWQAWHSSPKRKKATNDQKQMAVDKLDAWRQNGEDFAAALENAAVGGYQGLFLPDKKHGSSGETAYQRSMREKMEVMAPAIAAKAPGVPRTNPNNFFDALPNAKPLEITQ